MRLWKSHLTQGQLPPLNLITDLIPAIGFDKVHFEEGHFWKDHDATSLDLSGIAKGYAIDLLLERLCLEMNISDLFVEWGGEIRAAGKHPEGRAWNIFISRLGQTVDTLNLNDQAIASSGDYLQNWTIDSITYCHIIDPRHLRPLQNGSITSASVLAPTCALADGLATAAMLFDTIEEGKKVGRGSARDLSRDTFLVRLIDLEKFY